MMRIFTENGKPPHNSKSFSRVLVFLVILGTGISIPSIAAFRNGSGDVRAFAPKDRNIALSSFVLSGANNNQKPNGVGFEVAQDEDKTLRLASYDFMSNFTDPDPSDHLVRIKIVSLPENGTLYVYTSKAAIGQEVTPDLFDFIEFKPFPDYAGTTSFDVLPYDGSDYSDDNWTITIKINQVNDPPVFDLLSAKVVDEDFVANVRIGPQPHYFTGEEDQIVTYSLSPQNTDLVEVFFNPTDGEISFGSLPDKFGEVEFTITADDGQPVNNTYFRKVKIVVKAVNDAPVLAPIADVETALSSVTLDLDVKDPDGVVSASMFSAFSSNARIVRSENIKFSSSEDGHIRMTITREATIGDTDIMIQMDGGSFFVTQHFTFTSLMITGVENEKETDIIVFPNPVERAVQIRSDNYPEVMRIVVRDMQGRILQTETIDSAPYMMDISDIAPGTYVLEISGNRGTAALRRIVKR